MGTVHEDGDSDENDDEEDEDDDENDDQGFQDAQEDLENGYKDRDADDLLEHAGGHPNVASDRPSERISAHHARGRSQRYQAHRTTPPISTGIFNEIQSNGFESVVAATCEQQQLEQNTLVTTVFWRTL